MSLASRIRVSERLVSPLMEGFFLNCLTVSCPPVFASISAFDAPAGWTLDSLLSGTVSGPAEGTCLQPSTTIDASVSPGRRLPRTSSTSSPLVYSILVEDKQVNIL